MSSFGLVLDCADPEILADFWAAALGYATLGSAGNYVLLVAADGNHPSFSFPQAAACWPNSSRQ